MRKLNRNTTKTDLRNFFSGIDRKEGFTIEGIDIGKSIMQLQFQLELEKMLDYDKLFDIYNRCIDNWDFSYYHERDHYNLIEKLAQELADRIDDF